MLRCNVAPHLEVLDSDRQLFDSELKLTQDRANQLLAIIALYTGPWVVAGKSTIPLARCNPKKYLSKNKMTK
ncbi:MAG: hypothetical protein ACLP7A_06130 [Desulfobaccales bacterium]